MNTRILDFIDFEKVDALLEGFNQSTGFVTAILDLDGHVLSKSGWRSLCTEFHRVHPETARRCVISDTILANELNKGERFKSYQCLNGLVDVAVPLIVKGEHIANIFTGQFFFEEPDPAFFKKQAKEFGFNEAQYLEAMKKVPIVSKEKVVVVMDFMLNLTQLISEMTLQRMEQMAMNVAVKASEQRFRVIFENSQAVMLLIDPETHRIVTANNAAERFYGWKRPVLETMRIDDINTLTPVEIQAEMQKAKSSERTYFRFNHRLAKGDVRAVQVYSSKVDIDGKAYLHSIIHDITEQVEAERALQESQSYNRTLFEQSLIGLALTTMDGRMVDINTAFAAIIGRTIEETKQLTYWEITPEKYAQQEQEQLNALAKTGRYGPYEKEYIHKDGHLVPVRLRGLLMERKGETYIWSSVEDVSEKTAAEEKLRHSEERFKALHNASFGGIMIHDKGKLLDFNNGLCVLTGYSADELANMSVLELIAESHREEVNQKMTAGFEKPYESVGLHKCGHVFPVRIEAKNVPYHGKMARVAEFRDISEQKQALEEQEKSLALLNNLAAQVPGVVYQYRLYPDGRSAFPYASPGMWGIYEVTPEEVREDASPVFSRLHPDDYEYIVETIQASAANQTNYESQFRVLLPQQGLRWRQCHAKPELQGDGSTLWHGIIMDITDRKKSEQQLLHMHDLMQYIIEHNKSAVAVHDRNLHYIYVSQRYLEDYRIKEKDVIGKHHYDVFPDLPEKWRKVHQKALKGIVSHSDEDPFHREDGTVDWTRWECRPWYEADGTIGGIIVYTEVINEQKRKEEEIKLLNSRLEILVESIQQLSAAQSMDRVQTIVTQSARKLIGADGATLVLRDEDRCVYINEDAIQPLWKGKSFSPDDCVSGWVMKHHQSVVIEDIKKDRRIPQASYNPTFVKSMAMVPINTQNPIGAIGNYWKKPHKATDTDVQLLQTLADAAARAFESIRLYTELEDRVKIRTEQLLSANKELETFTYSVSHDLKAPLRGIDGYSKLLLDDYGDNLPEEAAFFVKTIRSSTLQMNQLIDDLLNYSRLERSEFKKEHINLNQFVETLLGGYKAELAEKGFAVHSQIPDVHLVADATGLSIALRNFLENAIKFTAGVPQPNIDIGFEETPSSWIIWVKDNGVGFEMKYHDRIFEIFQRLHRAEDFPGTGIGLAMVAKALQRMGGKAWAESKLDEGAQFFMAINKP
jgi:PAS domain S-box-containing protein